VPRRRTAAIAAALVAVDRHPEAQLMQDAERRFRSGTTFVAVPAWWVYLTAAIAAALVAVLVVLGMRRLS
jgi:hypothetical protein